MSFVCYHYAALNPANSGLVGQAVSDKPGQAVSGKPDWTVSRTGRGPGGSLGRAGAGVYRGLLRKAAGMRYYYNDTSERKTIDI